jgi:mono/diheme cytochrome c family protein
MDAALPVVETNGRPMGLTKIVLKGDKMRFSGTPAQALAVFLMLAAFEPPIACAADAANGENIASRWCNSCHLATSRQQVGSDLAPPFSRIANDATLTPQGLRAALSGRHPRMPDFALAREQIDDLSAYLRTLRK